VPATWPIASHAARTVQTIVRSAAPPRDARVALERKRGRSTPHPYGTMADSAVRRSIAHRRLLTLDPPPLR